MREPFWLAQVGPRQAEGLADGGVLLGQDQLAAAGDAQSVLLIAVMDVQLSRTLEQRLAGDLRGADRLGFIVGLAHGDDGLVQGFTNNNDSQIRTSTICVAIFSLTCISHHRSSRGRSRVRHGWYSRPRAAQA